MTNIINFPESNNDGEKVNIQIDAQIIEQLKQIIIDLTSRGLIRNTIINDITQYSVLDVIQNAAGKKSVYTTWNRLKAKHGVVLTKCKDHQFDDGSYKKTPVSDLSTCIEVVILLPGEISDKLRALSANITSQVIEQIAETEKPHTAITSANSSLELAKMLLTQMSLQQQAIASFIQAQEETNARLAQLEENNAQTQEAIAVIQESQEQTQGIVAEIQEAQEEAKAQLQKIDLPEFPAQEMSDRNKVSWLVNTYVRMTGADRQDIWRSIYADFRLRYNTDLAARAANATKKLQAEGKKSQVSKMDIAEQIGMLKELYATAYALLIQ